ncbi:MAG: hypothetical protein R3Y59_03530 [bacterium]
MASRRLLKKQVHNILSELMNECMVCNILLPKFDNTQLDTFAGRIIETYDEFIGRINNQEKTLDRKRVRAYYATFVKDFNTQVFAIIADMNKLEE